MLFQALLSHWRLHQCWRWNSGWLERAEDLPCIYVTRGSRISLFVCVCNCETACVSTGVRKKWSVCCQVFVSASLLASSICLFASPSLADFMALSAHAADLHRAEAGCRVWLNLVFWCLWTACTCVKKSCGKSLTVVDSVETRPQWPTLLSLEPVLPELRWQ